MDYAGIDAGPEQHAAALPPAQAGEEDEWWMGSQYCLLRELPDQLAAPPPPAQLYSRPARKPVSTCSSFTLLAAVDDATAWPLPSKLILCKSQCAAT